MLVTRGKKYNLCALDHFKLGQIMLGQANLYLDLFNDFIILKSNILILYFIYYF